VRVVQPLSPLAVIYSVWCMSRHVAKGNATACDHVWRPYVSGGTVEVTLTTFLTLANGDPNCNHQGTPAYLRIKLEDQLDLDAVTRRTCEAVRISSLA
jgi:hypothetical protein